MCGLLKKIEERGEFESNNKERAHFFLLIIHQNAKNKNCKRTQCEPLEADALSHRQDEREKIHENQRERFGDRLRNQWNDEVQNTHPALSITFDDQKYLNLMKLMKNLLQFFAL